jgi:hypothetical protein
MATSDLEIGGGNSYQHDNGRDLECMYSTHNNKGLRGTTCLPAEITNHRERSITRERERETQRNHNVLNALSGSHNLKSNEMWKICLARRVSRNTQSKRKVHGKSESLLNIISLRRNRLFSSSFLCVFVLTGFAGLWLPRTVLLSDDGIDGRDAIEDTEEVEFQRAIGGLESDEDDAVGRKAL